MLELVIGLLFYRKNLKWTKKDTKNTLICTFRVFHSGVHNYWGVEVTRVRTPRRVFLLRVNFSEGWGGS